jgi:hypothetical protein
MGMTEAKWSSCSDPQALLRLLKGKASKRKLRLFACACCRRHRSVLRGKNHQVLEASEEFADGRISRKEMEGMRRKWFTFDYPIPLRGTWQAALSCASMTHSATWANEAADHAAEASNRPERERLVHAVFLHDIFGNPFRPVTVDPSWLAWNDGTVVQLAQGIYDDRAFDRLPVLADALEEAGCDNADILAHCRSKGKHVRGCWLIDLLLKRE